jgi:hypothetical protein|tara:strand:+ start:7883 stop:8713 length:831 start_codon:yes stop_codon:yes gene_type:complete
MEDRKINYSKYLFLTIAVIVILMLIFGQRSKEEIEFIGTDASTGLEDGAGSGILEIETFPNGADIHVDGLYSGKSPDPIYNVPAGLRNVIIKKDGYEDFIIEVNVKAGKKTYLEATLDLEKVEEKVEVADIIEGDVEIIGIIEEEIIETVEEEETEEILIGDLKGSGTVNIGEKFLLYYDFSEGEFAEINQYSMDVFSKRYNEYFVFTRSSPANIKTIAKSIDDIKKDDCAGILGQFEWLYSDQSLCVITKENGIAAIGGSWDNTLNAELKWKVFN